MILPLGGGRDGSTGAALAWVVPVSRELSAASMLLLLSSSACLAASLLKPISMISLRARSSTWNYIGHMKPRQSEEDAVYWTNV